MYNHKDIEREILDFWNKKNIYKKTKNKVKGKKSYFFIDGPPYTTGDIHVGHAWNKALKDVFLRYKRLQGFDIWDQPGFDMHGLPIEVKVEEKFGIKNKQEIISKFGLSKFIKECEKFAIDNMNPMIRDFIRMGVWMDWTKPYMTIKNEYIEGTWWAIKEAEKNGYLYEGLKAMTWCARCATALAKHELDYKNIVEDSIFFKFKVKNEKNKFLILWSTTPWTIAFNLAVMVNPDLDYVEAKVNNEIWIVAKALATSLINSVANKKFEVIKEFKGNKLEGLQYEHPFSDNINFPKSKNLHTVVLSDKYVDVKAGSGLVHCAPGCGPEDYEVGIKYGLKAFNEVDEHGVFSNKMGKFSKLIAKKDDNKFIEELEKKGSLIAKTKVDHDYAHCWRCENPVIYRSTVQWFLAVSKLREEMRKKNKTVKWQPDWAGNRWFDSWLKDLQDWCISRQRFWGIPLPIWKCDCGEKKVIGSKKELKVKIDDLHRPWIDKVELKCSCGKKMRRIEDVLDVWMDSGAAPWATLNYPSDKRLFNKLWPMDFILEGKDQIRGWFNSLICLAMVSHKVPSYKAVYMHGFVLDAYGRKMSKSLGNIISPYEVIDKYGADTMRYYMISGANPGLDLNYNFEDMKVKYRNLTILWNLHKYLIDYSNNVNPAKLKVGKFGVEEKYILAKLNSTIKEVTDNFEEFRLDMPPLLIEDLFLDLSRVYIQWIRDKLSFGKKEEQKVILSVLYKVLMNSLVLFSPISPFITEKIYQNLKKEFNLKEESVHLLKWSKHDKFDKKILDDVEVVKKVIQEILAERDKVQLGIRWPLNEAEIVVENVNAIKKFKDIIKKQVNVKKLKVKKGKLKAKLDSRLTEELEREGYTREIVRRIQNLRKKAKLKKENIIELYIKTDYDFAEFLDDIKEKVGAKKISFEEKGKFSSKEKIRDKEFRIGFDVVK